MIIRYNENEPSSSKINCYNTKNNITDDARKYEYRLQTRLIRNSAEDMATNIADKTVSSKVTDIKTKIILRPLTNIMKFLLDGVRDDNSSVDSCKARYREFDNRFIKKFKKIGNKLRFIG